MTESIRYQLSRVVKRLSPLFSDSIYLKMLFYLNMGKRLDLKHPKTFSEKLQWLKINQRAPFYTSLVDKLAVKQRINHLLGEDYVCPVLGVWDDVEEIDLDSLPDSFVLKTTYSGGNNGVAICKDKKSFDWEAAKAKLKEEAKRTDIYYRYREWPYKNVSRKVFAEKYLGDNLTDYKFYCFDGDADCVLVCTDRQKGKIKYYFFDKDWQLLPYNADSKNAPEGFSLPRPEGMGKLFDLAAQLSKGFPFVRVDFFDVEGKIYFAEYTLYPASGLDPKKTAEFEKRAGDKINLSLNPAEAE